MSLFNALDSRRVEVPKNVLPVRAKHKISARLSDVVEKSIMKPCGLASGHGSALRRVLARVFNLHVLFSLSLAWPISPFFNIFLEELEGLLHSLSRDTRENMVFTV